MLLVLPTHPPPPIIVYVNVYGVCVCVCRLPASFYELVNNLTTFLPGYLIAGVAWLNSVCRRVAHQMFGLSKYLHTFGLLMKIT